MRCGQLNCVGEAAHAMLWPGRSPMAVCAGHAHHAQALAHALGFNPVLAPLYVILEPLAEAVEAALLAAEVDDG